MTVNLRFESLISRKLCRNQLMPQHEGDRFDVKHPMSLFPGLCENLVECHGRLGSDNFDFQIASSKWPCHF